jgi:excisionase family DNA binding protein
VAEDRPTISAQEAATLLGVSKPTLLRLWAQGFLEGYRLTPYRNGQIRLYRDSVEQFDRQRKSQAPDWIPTT